MLGGYVPQDMAIARLAPNEALMRHAFTVKCPLSERRVANGISQQAPAAR